MLPALPAVSMSAKSVAQLGAKQAASQAAKLVSARTTKMAQKPPVPKHLVKDSFEKAGKKTVFDGASGKATASAASGSYNAPSQKVPKAWAYTYDASKIQASNSYGGGKGAARSALSDVLNGMHGQLYNYLDTQCKGQYLQKAAFSPTNMNCDRWTCEYQDTHGNVNCKNVNFLKDTANDFLKKSGSSVRIATIAPTREVLPDGHVRAKLQVEYTNSKGQPKQHLTLVTETDYVLGGVVPGLGHYHTYEP